MRYDSNNEIYKVVLQVANILTSPQKDSCILKEFIVDLVKNYGKDEGSGERWSDQTKTLFSVILDYGGPALVTQVGEQLDGPSLKVTYKNVRLPYKITGAMSLDTFERAKSFMTISAIMDH